MSAEASPNMPVVSPYAVGDQSRGIARIKFAILTPTYHRSDTYLPFCIETLRRQTKEYNGTEVEYEHIIINNDPDDEAASDYIFDEAASDPRITPVIAPASNGECAALNLGFSVAVENMLGRRLAGETLPSFIVPVADDDGLCSNALASYTRALQEDPSLEFIFGKAAFIDEHDQPTDETYGIDYNNVHYSDEIANFHGQMLRCNEVPRSAAIGVLALARVGLWEPQFRLPDWQIYVKLLHLRVRYRMLNETTDYYRMHPGQLGLEERLNGVWEKDGVRLSAEYPGLLDENYLPARPTTSLEYANAQTSGHGSVREYNVRPGHGCPLVLPAADPAYQKSTPAA
jgi:hypothetical protein